MIFSVILWLSAIVLLALSFSAAWWYKFWIIDIIGTFYLLFAGITLLLFCILLFQKRLRRNFWLIAVLAIALVFYAESTLLWYVPRVRDSKVSGVPVTVMAYNVNYRRWDTLATEKVVRAYPADILGLIEPEAGQAADLRARVKDIFPHYYRATGGNLSLFSRYPITAARTDNLQTRYHNLFATLNVQGKAAQVVVTHPLAPISRNYFNLRNQTIRSLANYAQKQKTPLIIMGDFNATSWSPYMRAFGQRSGLRNASQGHGIHLTWFYSNFRSPYQLIKIPIDHIFVSPNIPVSEITAGEPGVSDHRPVIAKIRF